MNWTTALKVMAENHPPQSEDLLAQHFGNWLVACAQLPKDSRDAQFIARVGQRLAEQTNSGISSISLQGWERDPESIAQLLKAHQLLADPGQANAPLSLEQDWLYLTRYREYERKIAQGLKAMAKPLPAFEPDETAQLRQWLKELFPDSKEALTTNWQRVAGALVLASRLTVLTGGPGTGKTSTIGRLLLLLLRQNPELKIRLAAPTGTAANRLTRLIETLADKLKSELGESWESVAHQYGQLLESLKLLESAETLHRLLGYHSINNSFRHGPDNPLAADLVIVDEASMVGLGMMNQLIGALDQQTRLILVGDSDQLISVDTGRVLADICSWKPDGQLSVERFRTIKTLTDCDLTSQVGGSVPPLADCLCRLKTNHRSDKSISELAEAVNQGNLKEVLGQLNQAFENIQWRPELNLSEVQDLMTQDYAEIYRSIRSMTEPEEMLNQLAAFRLLCPTRQGQSGSLAMAQAIEQKLREQGLIDGGLWYHGQLVMITSNNYHLNLFNGDTGVIVRLPEGYKAYFRSVEGGVRALDVGQLPPHELALAVTVHKSQGLEFGHVGLLVPDQDALSNRSGLLISRRMLYTGMTRAKSKLTLWGSPEALEQAIGNTDEYHSGLRARLWS